MPNFKPKPKKKINKKGKSSVTLDGTHNEKMKLFHDQNTKILPELQKEKKRLIENINNEKNITKRLEMEDNLKLIKKKIKKIKKEKKNYLLKNSKHIFNYFEKKKINLKVIIKQKSYIIFLIKVKLKIMILKKKIRIKLSIIIYLI